MSAGENECLVGGHGSSGESKVKKKAFTSHAGV